MNDGYPWWAPILSGLAAWASTTATRWLRDRRRMTRKTTSDALARNLPPSEPPLPPSTTWEWRKVRMSRAPQATEHSTPKGRGLRALPRRNRREPLHITVKLRGGPEAWVEVHARGQVLRVPGWTSVSDLVDMVNSHF